MTEETQQPGPGPKLSQAELDAQLNETVAAHAAQLSLAENCKVHPIIFKDKDTGETIIGYIKEPSRQIKLAVMDKAMVYPISSVAEVLPSLLLNAESDPRLWDEKPENDKYFLGACNVVYDIITMATNQFKKK